MFSKPRQQEAEPSWECSKKAFKLIKSRKYIFFQRLVILLNALVLMSYYHRQSHNLRIVLRSFNILFLTIFTFDIILRILSFGRNYFLKSLSVVDIIMVVTTITNFIININFDKILDSDWCRLV